MLDKVVVAFRIFTVYSRSQTEVIMMMTFEDKGKSLPKDSPVEGVGVRLVTINHPLALH